MAEKKKMGRPKKEDKPDYLKIAGNLASSGYSGKVIASYLGIAYDTLNRYCKEAGYKNFKDFKLKYKTDAENMILTKIMKGVVDEDGQMVRYAGDRLAGLMTEKDKQILEEKKRANNIEEEKNRILEASLGNNKVEALTDEELKEMLNDE